jgi:glycosyltransferase involved in cell wall biosynthesis
MRITFVLPCYPWTPMGGFRVVYQYANHLTSRGHEVSVVHTRKLRNVPPPGETSFRRWLGLRRTALRDWLFTPKVDWQPIDSRVRMKYVPNISEAVIPDSGAVFATFWLTAEEVLGLPLAKGMKFYLIQSYETWAGPRERVDATWSAPLHKVVISRWLYKIGLELDCGQMRYIPNGIDQHRYRLLIPIPQRAKRVAMLFSNVELKGSREGVKALQIAKSQDPELRAVLFGTPVRPKFLPKWIEYRQNPPQSELINDIYNGSSVFVCPSWLEGFPLPPAEAMACGCALVGTDIPGIREYAEENTTALLSPPKDPEALAKNLLRLLADEDFRIRIALNGHERIQAFTWERSTDLLEDYIRECLGKGQGSNDGESRESRLQ